MKSILSICLLVLILFSFSACIVPAPHDDTTSTVETTTAEKPSDTTSAIEAIITPLPEGYPLWEEILSDSNTFLSMGGSIVDTSKREYTYEEMVSDLEILAQRYPAYFSYHAIGTSVAGRTIYTAVLGNKNAPNQILVSAGIHGREYLTPILVMKQMELYLTYYHFGDYNGTPYSEIFENYCFYVVPMSNPDGVMLSQKGIDSVKDLALRATVEEIYRADFAAGRTAYTDLDEYLKYWKANLRGVDLNRNYDAQWDTYLGTERSSATNYKGPTVASEPETQALVGLVNSLSNLRAVLCIHSQGEVLYWNCGQVGTLATQTKELVDVLAERTDYYADGKLVHDASLSDWCALEKDLIAITVEVGLGICPLPIDQFSKIWNQNFDLFPLTASFFEGQ
ncbi:MAG: peptidase M14 [Clostridia bacterium]|nr:peptidase M14 [Clostridia bacterium]